MRAGFDFLSGLHVEGDDFAGERAGHVARCGAAAAGGRGDGRGGDVGGFHVRGLGGGAGRRGRAALVEDLDENVISFAIDGDAEFFHA